MRVPGPRVILLVVATLGSSILSAGTAFERSCATKDKDGRYSVDSLLIGCTTDPEGQKEVARRYFPACAHEHRSEEWVSFDLDPSIRPDLVASAEEVDKHVREITRRVFIENLNDCADGKPLFATCQGELLRKLARLMKPGARLYMDFYPMVAIAADDSLGTLCEDFSNSDYGVDEHKQVDSRQNPFWIVASRSHFALASQPDSPLDTWGGRDAFHAFYVPVLKNDDKFMAGLPSGATAKEVELRCKVTADTILARLLKEKKVDEVAPFAQAFYGAKLREPIVQFITGLGFQDVRIVRCPVHPLNGRKNQLLIVATQPEGPADVHREETKAKPAPIGEARTG